MDVKLVNDATALLSLRDSDFDSYSAFGEVVDNSIQAQSTDIKIKVDYEVDRHRSRKKTYAVMKEVAFGDNGCGMSSDTLHRCMQLGYSSRFNDRSGIGRFGVGMTLAAINQCKHIEIYSKQEGAVWHWTYVDLDEITSDPPTMSHIPIPEERKIPDQYRSLVSTNQGTLVIWSAYDRQPVSALEMLEEMKIWFGRTYRKFIWKGLNISLNEENILAIDPLYVTTKMTKFPDDLPAYEYKPIEIDWKVPLIDKPERTPDESVVTIRMSLLDKKFRKIRGRGGSSEATSRYIDRNEGFSILRNDREVFYGHIPHWPGEKFVERDRWWGCEISFNAVLDRAFTVKNIKRGAIPNKELKQTIYEKTKPTRDNAIEKIQDFWKENLEAAHQRILQKGGELRTGHEDAENVAAKTATDISVIDNHKDKKKEITKLVDDIKQNESDQSKSAWTAKFSGQPFSIVDESWRGPDFFETNHLGGADVIKYNKRHTFFEVLYKIIEDVDMENTDLSQSKQIKNLIDLLIISYSKAEASFEGKSEWTVDDFVERLRMNWGQYLKSYLATWLKEQNAE